MERPAKQKDRDYDEDMYSRILCVLGVEIKRGV